MRCSDVLYNRKAEPGAAHFPAPRLVDTVKTLKKPIEVFRRNPYSLVFDRNNNLMPQT
jgi:hypothetical protein